MGDRYEIFPLDEAGEQWGWRGPDGTEEAGHATRREAYDAVRQDRGDKVTDLYDADGNFVLTNVVRGGNAAIALLRADGSLVGELDHEVVENAGEPQRVSVTPAGESSAAGEE